MTRTYVGTGTPTGPPSAGVNAAGLRVIKVHGRRLGPDRYEAAVSAGGRGHTVKFEVRR